MALPKIGLIGAGRMASAIAEGVCRETATAPEQISVFDPSQAALDQFSNRIPSATICRSNSEVLGNSDFVILAVKPQVLRGVSGELRGQLDDSLVFSIAAGISLASLTQWLGTERVIRVMPNTPCLVGQGVSGYCGAPAVSESDLKLCHQVFATVGVCVRVTETQLEGITGMSGSGPAYVFSMIEGLSDGGVLMGLPREMATKLAIQTVLGSATLARDADEHPAVLREQVTSPGGTTARGLQTLEDRSFKGAVIAAVEASASWARKLGREAESPKGECQKR